MGFRASRKRCGGSFLAGCEGTRWCYAGRFDTNTSAHQSSRRGRYRTSSERRRHSCPDGQFATGLRCRAHSPVTIGR